MATTETMKKNKNEPPEIIMESNPDRLHMPYALARQDDLDAIERQKKLGAYEKELKEKAKERLQEKAKKLREAPDPELKKDPEPKSGKVEPKKDNPFNKKK